MSLKEALIFFPGLFDPDENQSKSWRDHAKTNKKLNRVIGEPVAVGLWEENGEK